MEKEADKLPFLDVIIENSSNSQVPVVRKPINANRRLKVNRVFTRSFKMVLKKPMSS